MLDHCLCLLDTVTYFFFTTDLSRETVSFFCYSLFELLLLLFQTETEKETLTSTILKFYITLLWVKFNLRTLKYGN